MSIQIKYKNNIGSFITAQQVQGLTSYQKVTYNNSQLQMIEEFLPIRIGTKKTVDYFMGENDVKTDVIHENINIALADSNITKFTLVIYFNKQMANGYTAWDWEEYNINNEFRFKGKSTFDNKDRIIFWCSYDIQTNALEPGAFKYYYGGVFDDENNDLLLTFHYYEDGTIEQVTDHNDFLGLNDAVDEDTLWAYRDKFDLDDHPYYKSANIILPTGNL